MVKYKINNKQYFILLFALLFVQIAYSTPQAGLDICTSDSQCQDKAKAAGISGWQIYICEGGYCRGNCDGVKDGLCINGQQKWVRPSICQFSDMVYYTTCETPVDTQTNSVKDEIPDASVDTSVKTNKLLLYSVFILGTIILVIIGLFIGSRLSKKNRK